jgi:hypothetical protein
VTAQVPDQVTYDGSAYRMTAIDGHGLFSPDDHGIEATAMGTACYRGFLCSYAIVDDNLILRNVEIGRNPDQPVAPVLFGVEAQPTDEHSHYKHELMYHGLAAHIKFTGRLLLGRDEAHVGRLHMGFRPAWSYEHVQELSFDKGRLLSAHDRSADLAHVRDHIGAAGLRPADADDRPAWIERTFSLSFDYSWPSVDSA